jgi:hypothetical protein
MNRFAFGLTIALCLSLVCGAAADAQQSQASAPQLLIAPFNIGPDLACGTPQAASQDRFRQLEALAPGLPLFFTQEPGVLPPNHTGQVVFRDFLVMGDVPVARFRLLETNQIETWPRTGTRDIGGSLVSVFSPTWPASRIAALMRSFYWGWDSLELPWVEFLPEGVGPGGGYTIWVRLAPATIPVASVRPLAADVQYSGNVVNLAIPGYGDARATEDQDDHRRAFSLESVAQKFYQHFEDSYDTISVVPADTHVTAIAAVHVNVKNQVTGVGIKNATGQEVFDVSSEFGSGGRLQSVEVFSLAATLGHSKYNAHELAHQWGSYIDWERLSGLPRAGHQPDRHDPLMDGGATLLGAVLAGTRQVRNTGGAWVIERSSFPIKFHPLTMYAMGLIPKERVPAITLFDDQGQFGVVSGGAEPAVGSPVAGGTRTATVFNVIGALGERAGPVPSEWQRAIVVVSRDRLLTQREMDYWTFVAQRIEDPNRSGVASFDGYVSFDAATDRGIDSRTGVRPKNGAVIAQNLGVDFPNFGTADLNVVALDGPLATRYGVGQRPRFTGRVTAPDRSDFNAIVIALVRDNAIVVRGDGVVSSSGSFTVEMPALEASHRGRFMLQVFLLFPGAGSQQPRAIVGPMTVE